ncbi:hypothetical protein [Fidelibacter multiformis]|uniref:hypothetical protein n=1 Tax=Fidelibacter multiformis TaxID=3377529 RepID=UPI0037DDA162
MIDTLKHPFRFIWDFWYYYEPVKNLFHVFYLNADPSLVPSEQFHWASHSGGIWGDQRFYPHGLGAHRCFNRLSGPLG